MTPMFDNSPMKMQATRAFVVFSILFFVVSIGMGLVIAADKGYGTGPWDTRTVWSCHTPGGPYYVDDLPVSEQPCPSPYSPSVGGHGVLPEKEAPPHPSLAK